MPDLRCWPSNVFALCWRCWVHASILTAISVTLWCHPSWCYLPALLHKISRQRCLFTQLGTRYASRICASTSFVSSGDPVTPNAHLPACSSSWPPAGHTTSPSALHLCWPFLCPSHPLCWVISSHLSSSLISLSSTLFIVSFTLTTVFISKNSFTCPSDHAENPLIAYFLWLSCIYIFYAPNWILLISDSKSQVPRAWIHLCRLLTSTHDSVFFWSLIVSSFSLILNFEI